MTQSLIQEILLIKEPYNITDRSAQSKKQVLVLSATSLTHSQLWAPSSDNDYVLLFDFQFKDHQ